MTRFASARDARLAYDAAGAGDPPMIFVHGWCCDRSYFDPQVTRFSASHAVVTVDLRGHGESSALAVAPGIAADLLRAMSEFDGASVLGGATAPVLSIGSAVPANSADDLRRACPAITIGQTVGAGHFIQLEVPDQVNAMIERFLTIADLT
jgi:pimeloyl-ACP methyl ester carboxylesterase